MLICDEYLDRHSIRVPTIPHVKSGVLLFRESNFNWFIFSIKWKEADYHPGGYIIKVSAPAHNGLGKFDAIAQLPPKRGRQQLVYWDEYEDYIQSWWQSNSKIETPKNEKEVWLAVWDVFIYSCDKYLAQQMYVGRMFNIIDTSQSIEYRYSYLITILEFMENCHPLIYDVWEKYFAPLIKSYCYWLPDNLCPAVTLP